MHPRRRGVTLTRMTDQEDAISPVPDPAASPAAAFRQFSLTAYSAPQVEGVCLALQESHGLDVNLLLLCCWVGRHGVRLPTDTLRRADQAVAPWRETAIGPLRALRRRLKASVGGIGAETAADLRRKIKEAELDAEFIEQDHLMTLMDHLPGTDGRAADRAGLVRGNLIRYASMAGIAAGDMPRDAFEILVAATVPGMSAAEGAELDSLP
ncbi:TIGR02444 family protein [Pacificispira sp.]|uniref:TIGR02444 family protein n=1 Tax=Pacificispira sp. TaxID=2888761 RepID=UPI003B5290A5